MNNDWIKWIIPLIALLVWIITNLAKPHDEKDQAEQRKRRRDRDNKRRSQTAQTKENEVEEFLKEIQIRQKREEQQQRKKSIQPPQKPSPEKIPEVIPISKEPLLKRRKEAEHLEQRIALPKAPPPPPIPKPKLPEVVYPNPLNNSLGRKDKNKYGKLPVPETTANPDEPIITVQEVKTKGAGTHSQSELDHLEAYQQKKYVERATGSTVANEVTRMLTDPSSVRAAFILREVLDRPLSQRRR